MTTSVGVVEQVITNSTADPMPGFGFLIGVGAILIAIYIAIRKRRRYTTTDESPEMS